MNNFWKGKAGKKSEVLFSKPQKAIINAKGRSPTIKIIYNY